jgi:N-acetylglutamate synthase-like GNAT family acetyltransferase
MATSIDAAGPADWPEVLALLEASNLPVGGLEEHLATALVARDDGAVVGSVALELFGSDALLRSLAVRPELRGQGLGRRLTDAALLLARERAIQRVYLLTETAAPFFRRLGFRDVARPDVPERVRNSLEFRSLCPASAEALTLNLAAAGDEM